MDHRARSWVAAACLALAVGACADEQEALIVLSSPAFADGDCIASPDATEFLQRGVLDLGYETGYTLPVVLLNNLVSRSGKSSSTGVDNGELQLRNVDVSVAMPQAPEVIAQVRAEDPTYVQFSVTLPSVSMAPGSETGVLVDVIPQGAGAAYHRALVDNLPEGARPTLEASMVFHATRTGNSRGSLGILDSRDYTFPIELCVGCLAVTCESCLEGMCPVGETPVGVCGNAQDGLLFPPTCGPPE